RFRDLREAGEHRVPGGLPPVELDLDEGVTEPVHRPFLGPVGVQALMGPLGPVGVDARGHRITTEHQRLPLLWAEPAPDLRPYRRVVFRHASRTARADGASARSPASYSSCWIRSSPISLGRPCLTHSRIVVASMPIAR